MAITHWPAQERPREKLLRQGARSLSDAELLAIFLRTGVNGKSAVDLARELMLRFDSLEAIFSASENDLTAINGIDKTKYTLIQAILELASRVLLTSIDRAEVLQSASDTRRYLQAVLAHQQREVFWCLFLDNQHRIIASEALFYGTIDSASVYPREVLKTCLKHNAAAVIFAHNHPSGVAEPSQTNTKHTQHPPPGVDEPRQADISLTHRLSEALALIDIRTLDHIVVGNNRTISMAERGLL